MAALPLGCIQPMLLKVLAPSLMAAHSELQRQVIIAFMLMFPSSLPLLPHGHRSQLPYLPRGNLKRSPSPQVLFLT
eukprot:scaffold245588_cov21-Tisochrysis_lutea.AAC.2